MCSYVINELISDRKIYESNSHRLYIRTQLQTRQEKTINHFVYKKKNKKKKKHPYHEGKSIKR